MFIKKYNNDYYKKLAYEKGYRARSIYKLKEIDKKKKIINLGQTIVDFGSSPGSWSQYVSKKLQNKNNKNIINGTIISIDIIKMKPINGVTFIQGNILNKKTFLNLNSILNGKKIDVILCDISPNISGIKIIDSSNFEKNINIMINFSKKNMKKNGYFLIKYFNINNIKNILNLLKKNFKIITIEKPISSKNKSSEFFFLSKGINFFNIK